MRTILSVRFVIGLALLFASGFELARITPVYASACGLTWQVIPTPNVGTSDNFLSSVAAVAANDVWAGGAYVADDADHSLMLHWDGAAWISFAVPDVGNVSDLEVVAPNDIWASGTSPLHWNGTAWLVVPSPAPIKKLSAVASDNVWAINWNENVLHWDGVLWVLVTAPVINQPNVNFEDIYAVSSSDVWLVGWWSPGSAGSVAIVQHWDGSAWTSGNAADAESPQLSAIDGSSDGALWLGGSDRNAPEALMQRWDGAAWQSIVTPTIFGDYSGSVGFNAIDVRASDDVWAAGYTYTVRLDDGNPLIEHWDGVEWQVQVVPFSPNENESLSDVSAWSQFEVWAVGGIKEDGIYNNRALYGALPCNATSALPPSPKLVSPPKGVTVKSLPLILDWKKISGATFYHVQVVRKDQPYPPVIDKRIERSKLRIKILPFANKKYLWRVFACNDYGCSHFKERSFFFKPDNE